MTVTTRVFADLPHECPPGSARMANDKVFACSSSDPPTQQDVATAAERGTFKGKCECQRRSYSVFLDRRDAEHLLSMQQSRFSCVVSVKLEEEHGLIQHTPSRDHQSHHSVWTFKGVVFHTLFASVT